ncbi:MAG: hypothetical protein IPN73_02930 [Saprospiraceae bacterium]|nr:hypothetical protein [Saprospiraceae bacterium]
MKKRNLVLLMLCLVLEIVVLKGQSDLQWYIVNADGKKGTLAGNNNYCIDLTRNDFTILGVKYPGDPPKKNDIFVVYTDGEHFNSRYDATFNLVKTSGTNEGYYLQCSKQPLVLYFTDLYEGEDDPPFVEICEGQSRALAPTSVTTSSPNALLTANHDAIPGKDITVIVRKPNNENIDRNLTLDYDETLLSLSEIFPNNMASYPGTDNTIDLVNGKINLVFNTSNYQYINFNVNSTVPSGIDDLLFTLTSAETPIATLVEAISQSHDPNYVEVLNIFEKNPREYWAHMHVQCYNDSRKAHVNDAQIALSFPATVDASTLEMTDWSYGLTKGGLTQVALVKNTDRVYFNFSNVPDILNMQGPDYYYVDPSQVGWVEFIVKINSSDPREVANINLRPLRPMTFFDGTPYNITKFIDRCFGNLSDRNDLCERKIESSYYMNQFVETLSIEESRAVLTAGSSNYSDHQVKQCEKDKCSKKDCEKKCKKRRNRFWKRALPWVIAGVMTVIAIAD